MMIERKISIFFLYLKLKIKLFSTEWKTALQESVCLLIIHSLFQNLLPPKNPPKI